ncbi:hypothetical protein XU18_2809 [Perkinsela sp. CCAP 1560/4]|nr:hypothetical protein XU18_2809 [Perkinsela sp. CCAP 1560/4]|eukprot:KNH06304.1 hypothetical protein XU18_2809 [Perkinsela sp. CCAP 1560/4]
MAIRMHFSWINFIFISLCSLVVMGIGSIAAITPYWSRLQIPSEMDTPLTTATGGYELTGSYHAGIFQFCLENHTEGKFGTCYGITMPMDYQCHGPSGESVRKGSQLYLRIIFVRICMLLGILFSLSVAIVTCIGSFKKRRTIYNWCAFCLALLQTVAFTAVCALYGHTESYWYKCGHNQCAGVDRCLFSFGYSYALAIGCMFLSFFILGYLWSLRRVFSSVPKKKIMEITETWDDPTTIEMPMSKDSPRERRKGELHATQGTKIRSFPWSKDVKSASTRENVKLKREPRSHPLPRAPPATQDATSPVKTHSVEPQIEDESQSNSE